MYILTYRGYKDIKAALGVMAATNRAISRLSKDSETSDEFHIFYRNIKVGWFPITIFFTKCTKSYDIFVHGMDRYKKGYP